MNRIDFIRSVFVGFVLTQVDLDQKIKEVSSNTDDSIRINCESISWDLHQDMGGHYGCDIQINGVHNDKFESMLNFCIKHQPGDFTIKDKKGFLHIVSGYVTRVMPNYLGDSFEMDIACTKRPKLNS